MRNGLEIKEKTYYITNDRAHTTARTPILSGKEARKLRRAEERKKNKRI